MRRLVLLVPLLALLVAGCGSKRSIVGVWEGKEKVRSITESIEFDMKSDGTYAIRLVLQGTTPGKQINMQETGTYRVVGESKLGTTGQNYSYSGLTGEQLEGMKKIMEVDKGKESLDNITWTDNDNIVLTSADGHPISLKRKK